ncbi:MAG: 4-vinyl reductase [Bradyrhizobium sp.]|uniref:DUF5943 domain-containing protein n=1 Tax=Bradyrhizobium sp. TaxID=376 RepID=UPI001DB886FC|nr:DUF5943 domain-containing protein [Bradyrhizobium sp.]MBV9562795.1 4-vinyl reductase [Bradyrhizobium sp.]
MAKPAIDIQVDEATGRWSVDALPMILVPQHFFLNNHYAVEAVLGPGKLEEVLRPAGYRSAYFWCEKEAAFHGLDGAEVFRHYLRRLSQRGWAQFEIAELSPEAGTARIVVRHSALIDPVHVRDRRKCCYMFSAWFEGALDYVTEKAARKGKAQATELYCAGEGNHDHCMFEVAPA